MRFWGREHNSPDPVLGLCLNDIEPVLQNIPARKDANYYELPNRITITVETSRSGCSKDRPFVTSCTRLLWSFVTYRRRSPTIWPTHFTICRKPCIAWGQWRVEGARGDSEGAAWGFHFVGRKEKFSLLDRLLAEVYNPCREFPVSYSQLRSDQFAELQRACLDGVAHDDDILTQFLDWLYRCIRFFDGDLGEWEFNASSCAGHSAISFMGQRIVDGRPSR